MLEVRLRSGQIVTFDGRVVEVLADGVPSSRLHLAQLPSLRVVEGTDGAQLVALAGRVTLAFAGQERPACMRLLAAIADARDTLDRLGGAEPAVG